MPDAVTFIIGANSQPFQTEMRKMDAIAKASSRSIAAGFASGHSAGMSGLIREAITVPREIVEGRGAGRVIGSLSLLIGYMGNLFTASNKATSALEAQLEVEKVLAFNTSKSANEAQKLADSIRITEVADKAEAEAAILNAEAADAVALSKRLEAESHVANIAAIEEEIAVTKIQMAIDKAATPWYMVAATPLWIVVAALAAVAATAALVYYQVKKSIELLTGPELGDQAVTKINNQAYGLTRIAKAWRDIADAVQGVTDKYNAAYEVAKRLAEVTDAARQTEDSLNETHEQTELAGANTPEKKLEIEKRYSDLAIANMHKRNEEDRKARETTVMEIAKQERDKGREMDELNRRAHDADANNTAIKNQEELQKKDKEFIDKFGAGADEQEANRQRAIQSGAYSATDLPKSEQTTSVEAARARYAAGAVALTGMRGQSTTDAEDLRKAEVLKKELEALETHARELIQSGHDEEAKSAQREADFKKEELARLALVQAQDHGGHGGAGRGTESLNALQRIGGQRTVQSSIDSLHAQQETARNTRRIAAHLDRSRSSHHTTPRQVIHGVDN